MGALDGVVVLDFTQLVPGPLASLWFAQAGAEVVKVEPPGGDALCHAMPQWPHAPALYELLNRGKRVLRIDLRDPAQRPALEALLARADVLLEGFRPGVMQRLGLDYATLSARDPRLVYCSITGYGQSGRDAQKAGHDLTYLAESGLLALFATRDGVPVVPGVLLADIAGGSYPAVAHVLAALFERERTGRGAYLDVAMTKAVAPFALWARANAEGGAPPQSGRELLTGGSPRYALYATRDGRWLAVAALEEKFWQTFCTAIALDPQWRDDARDPEATRAAVASKIAAEPAHAWQARFAGLDACAAVVATFAEAGFAPDVFPARVPAMQGAP
jgi:crotonobetainyl-CoA:carnitine CoA-transferase CaiB-like acyl-CoA transferase